MEVFESKNNIILLKDKSALFCDRSNGSLQITPSDRLQKEWNPCCLGTVLGFIGKLKLHPEGAWYLLFIRDATGVCTLPDDSMVYHITRVSFLPLTMDPLFDLNFDTCVQHHTETGSRVTSTDKGPSDTTGKPFIRAVQNTFKTLSTPVKQREQRDREKFERRMQEELTRLFQEDGGFYFSYTGDLSNTLQVQFQERYRAMKRSGVPLWKRVDERYFWNQCLLVDLLKAHELGHCSTEEANPFLLPIIQGYVELSPPIQVRKAMSNRPVPTSQTTTPMRTDATLEESEDSEEAVFETQPSVLQHLAKRMSVDSGLHSTIDSLGSPEVVASCSEHTSIHTPQQHHNFNGVTTNRRKRIPSETSADCNGNDAHNPLLSPVADTIRVWLLSRRCKYQSGFRYRRRGVNKNGHVANYVETEQIILMHADGHPHYISFVQLRGSIPVFWSQKAMSYRPPVRLEKTESENQDAFRLHMENDIHKFGHIVTVSLVATSPESSERKVSDAFLKHLLMYNSDNLTHVMFDFHDYCSGTNFDNLSILLEGVRDILKEMRYCWADERGLITAQQGIFRINCMDCLDRTNVVQVLFAVVVLEIQLRKLGLLSPEESLPSSCHRCLAHMWGNNGDAVSTQYAGTVAMKGDFTRTGERTASGMMRDGISSMSRYYLRFREISRQSAMDLLTQNLESVELQFMQKGSEDASALMKEKEDNIKLFTRVCRQLCLQADEHCFAECIIISCDERETESRDMNTVVLITSQHYYVFSKVHPLPPRTDKVTCIKIPVTSCVKVEIGLQPFIFRARSSCLRLFYTWESSTTPRSANKGFTLQPIPSTPESSPSYSKLEDLQEAYCENGRSLPRSQSQLVFTSAHPSPGARTASPSSNQQLFFLTFCQPNMRFFNNLLLPIRDEEDALESLRAVAESIVAAGAGQGHTIELIDRSKQLERLRYKPPPADLIDVNITASSIYSWLPRSSLTRRELDFATLSRLAERRRSRETSSDSTMSMLLARFNSTGSNATAGTSHEDATIPSPPARTFTVPIIHTAREHARANNQSGLKSRFLSFRLWPLSFRGKGNGGTTESGKPQQASAPHSPTSASSQFFALDPVDGLNSKIHAEGKKMAENQLAFSCEPKTEGGAPEHLSDSEEEFIHQVIDYADAAGSESDLSSIIAEPLSRACGLETVPGFGEDQDPVQLEQDSNAQKIQTATSQHQRQPETHSPGHVESLKLFLKRPSTFGSVQPRRRPNIFSTSQAPFGNDSDFETSHISKALSDSELESTSKDASSDNLPEESQRSCRRKPRGSSVRRRVMIEKAVNLNTLREDGGCGASNQDQSLAGVLTVKTRCQRVSRELSCDEVVALQSSVVAPPGNGPRTKERLSATEIQCTEKPPPAPHLSSAASSVLPAISEVPRGSQLSRSGSTISCSTTTSSLHVTPRIGVIRMPSIDMMSSSRLAQRLHEKRLKQIAMIEDLRKSLLNDEELRMNLIIF